MILNEGLQKIGEFAFSGCTSLQTFTIPTLSTRLNDIIQTRHWRDANDKINEVRGVVERGDNELFIPAAAMEDDDEEDDDEEEEDEENSSWEAVRQNLDRIINVIRHYEKKEATSLFELALWKLKIDLLDNGDKDDDECRKDCRTHLGPVMDTFLQYL